MENTDSTNIVAQQPEPVNDYELARQVGISTFLLYIYLKYYFKSSVEVQKRIRENKARLSKLGVAESVAQLKQQHSTESQRRRKARLKKRKEKSKRQAAEHDRPVDMEVVVTRRSKRLREVGKKEEDGGTMVEDCAEERPTKKSRYISFTDEDMSMTIVAPFSLLKERITVQDLGHIHRKKYAHKYWSSSGCKYHHAYPVGYRATKNVFGKCFEMSIEESETGPLFTVYDTVNHTSFVGDSPTSPWTQVCIAQRTGQRISGPLFYGFSDLFTLKALAKNLYNEEEMAAAVSGCATRAQVLSVEEVRAQEFSAVDGVGPKTAEILSRVDVTGEGKEPKSLKELSVWLNASEKNKDALLFFLTTDESVPSNTRRWAQWPKTIAPKIVKNIVEYTHHF